jgi:hypothetical protein
MHEPPAFFVCHTSQRWQPVASLTTNQ